MLARISRYERVAWIPVLVSFLVALGVGGKHFSNLEPSTPATAAAVLSFGHFRIPTKLYNKLIMQPGELPCTAWMSRVLLWSQHKEETESFQANVISKVLIPAFSLQFVQFHIVVPAHLPASLVDSSSR